MRPAIVLAVVLAALPAAAAGAGRSGGEEVSRFTLRASLEPGAKSIGDGRFRMHGQLTREGATPTHQAHGFALTASLAPAGAGQCNGELIFADGFE